MAAYGDPLSTAAQGDMVVTESMGQLGGPVDEDYGATAGGSMMSVSNSFMQYGGAEGSELGPGYTGPSAVFSGNPFAGTVVQESGGAASSSQAGSRQAASSAPAPQPTGGSSTATANGVAGVRRPVERVPLPDIKVPPPSGDRAQLYITVTQPKPQIGPGKLPGLTEPYISYQVATETRLQNSSGQQVVVWRRFKDFVALDELLRLTHRGMFIPPRPEKLVLRMGKNSDPVFVEKRRMALQAYLNRLTSHHALRCSEELRVFLEEPGELRQSIAWQQLQPLQATWMDGTVRLLRQAVGQEGKVPAPSEAARPADQSADILRKIKEVMARRQGESGMASTGSLDTPSLDDEALLRQKKCVLRDMAIDFKRSSLAARQVVIAGQGVGEELAGLSAAAQELARLEERYQHVSPRHLDTTAASLGGLARVTMRKAMESSNMLVGLHGYARLMPCVLQALEQREEALVTVQVLEADMAKCSQAGRQQGAAGQGATVRKAQQLTRDRAALEAAKQAGLSEYTRVMSRNLDELRWMENDQLLELGRVLIGFAVEQKALADESFLAWAQLAEDIGANRARIAKLRASSRPGGSSS